MNPTENQAKQRQMELPRRGRAFQVAALGLILVSGLAGTGLARWLRPAPPPDELDIDVEAESKKTSLTIPARYFRDWTTKPDLAVVLTGSQHGYLLPCGCSRPQVGGLERRYNFVEALRAMGWNVAAVDVGDVPQIHGPHGLGNEQGLIKYRYAMEGLKRIGYSAVSFGEHEGKLTLEKALGEYALNSPVPRVLAANLENADANFPEQVADWIEIKNVPIKTGVTAVIGKSVIPLIKDPLAKFERDSDALKRVVPKMNKEGIELRILLYQGFATNHKQQAGGARLVANAPKAEAIQAAEEFPQFQIVLALGEEDEPSGNPILANGDATLVTSLGHKGKYVGVVGVWRTKGAKAFELKYQLVDMSEDFLTPKGKEEGHPIVKLMDEYTEELKRDNYLGKFGQTKHPSQVTDPVPGLAPKTPRIPQYMGSESCKRCHKDAYKVWENTAHSHAYKTLVDAKRPSLRQYDAECVVCHTTGFGYLTGFAYDDKDRAEKLKNVGCESCHGPGSHHVLNSNNVDWQLRMNPWKPAANENAAGKVKRLGRIDRLCQGCHDIDNDVTWTPNGFDKKWPKIAHPTPVAEPDPEEKK